MRRANEAKENNYWAVTKTLTGAPKAPGAPGMPGFPTDPGIPGGPIEPTGPGGPCNREQFYWYMSSV